VIATSSRSSSAGEVRLQRYYMLLLADELPDRAELLRSLEHRIEEASVALKVRGTSEVPEDAPTLTDTSLATLRIAPDGSVRESEPVRIGGVSADPGAVGYRLEVSSSDVRPGAMLSARLTIDGVEEPAYSTDVAWPDGSDHVTVDLLTPFGEARYPVDPGAYALRIHVDGKSVETLEWHVPTDRGPALQASVDELVSYLRGNGWQCAPSTADVGEVDTCQLRSGATSFVATFIRKDGSFQMIQLGATRGDDAAILEDVIPLFGTMLRRIYGPALGADLIAWVEEREAAFGQIRVSGTWLQSTVDSERSRWLTILPEEPA
jgi:hypothetical protein